MIDKKSIGLIVYASFIDVFHNQKFTVSKIKDNFDWENSMIQQIKAWIQKQGLTVEEAFKCFDMNFDGYISKDDLNKSLQQLLEIPKDEILATKLDRLFNLMDFFK